jgi:hypothetical protein
VATDRGLVEVGWRCRGESRPWHVVAMQEDSGGTPGGGVLCSGASSVVAKSSGEVTPFSPLCPCPLPSFTAWCGQGKASSGGGGWRRVEGSGCALL